jgi:hypothetical protein
MAAVVVNCPPLGGIDRLPSAPRISGSVPMQVKTTALARSRCHIITRYVTALPRPLHAITLLLTLFFITTGRHYLPTIMIPLSNH